MDERPTLDVDNLSCSLSLLKRRHRAFKKRVRSFHTKQERKRMSYIIKKYRAKQRQLLSDESDEQDPDPFVPSYIFFCFTGTLTE